jgi:hypothetical protein
MALLCARLIFPAVVGVSPLAGQARARQPSQQSVTRSPLEASWVRYLTNRRGVSCAGCVSGRVHISHFWRFGIPRRDCEDGTWESRSNRSRFAAAGGRVQYWRFGLRRQGDYGLMFWLMWNRLPGSYARLT